jgi:CheY-like chemotaxis protein
LLGGEGYCVTTSLAMLDLARLKEIAPDLIIQDLLFPGVQETSWEFLTLVRLDPDLARIPLILCTAAIDVIRDQEMAQRLADQNVTVVLKPFNIDELLDVVERVLQPGRVDPGHPSRAAGTRWRPFLAGSSHPRKRDPHRTISSRESTPPWPAAVP